LIDFVEETRLERVGVFTYSVEDGTPAAKLTPKIPLGVAEERCERLMLAQQRIAFEWNDGRIGEVTEVLIDGLSEEDERSKRLCGRSYAEAPEIDSRIFLPDDAGSPGDLIMAKIVAREEYDLVAELA